MIDSDQTSATTTAHHARVLLIDFSSAFNSIRTHVLLKRLLDLKVNGGPILWIGDFLSDCSQRVIFNGNVSERTILITGAPHGTILSLYYYMIIKFIII